LSILSSSSHCFSTLRVAITLQSGGGGDDDFEMQR
jgi:hypothetical protein